MQRYTQLVEFVSYRVAHPLHATIFPGFRKDSQHVTFTVLRRNTTSTLIHHRM
jgi:DNA-directed RNA polymerase subunit L